jgi:PBSX family phage terminase large subunit
MIVEFSRSLLLPRYRELLDTDADIILLWGGRDSGKTYNIQRWLIRECLKDKNKVILCRKVKDTVKDSMFDGLVARLEEFNIHQLYRKTVSPTEINFATGAKVLCRGFDDPMKIKGIEQPTIGWVEEADQCNKNDYDILFGTLRHSYLKKRVVLSFNPEVDITGENWIINTFIGKENVESFYGQNIEFEREIEFTNIDGKLEKKTIKILSIHTTYRDNRFCPPEKRMAHESLKDEDVNKWNVYANGRLGQKEVKRPFFLGFNDSMIKDFDFDPSLETFVSFDFNVAPCTATISQQDYAGTFKRFLYEVRIGTKDSKADIYDVCEIIKQILPFNTYINVTGDATGRNSNALTKGELMAYDIIMDELNLSIDNFKVPKVNMSHKFSYTLCNKVLRNVQVSFHSRMKYTILDLKFLEYDGQNIMKKEAEKLGRGHLADCVRYDLHVNFLDL